MQKKKRSKWNKTKTPTHSQSLPYCLYLLGSLFSCSVQNITITRAIWLRMNVEARVRDWPPMQLLISIFFSLSVMLLLLVLFSVQNKTGGRFHRLMMCVLCIVVLSLRMCRNRLFVLYASHIYFMYYFNNNNKAHKYVSVYRIHIVHWERQSFVYVTSQQHNNTIDSIYSVWLFFLSSSLLLCVSFDLIVLCLHCGVLCIYERREQNYLILTYYTAPHTCIHVYNIHQAKFVVLSGGRTAVYLCM